MAKRESSQCTSELELVIKVSFSAFMKDRPSSFPGVDVYKDPRGNTDIKIENRKAKKACCLIFLYKSQTLLASEPEKQTLPVQSFPSTSTDLKLSIP